MYRKVENEAVELQLLSYLRKFSCIYCMDKLCIKYSWALSYMFSKAKYLDAVLFRLPAFLDEDEMVRDLLMGFWQF